jgi:hypothetical protein
MGDLLALQLLVRVVQRSHLHALALKERFRTQLLLEACPTDSAALDQDRDLDLAMDQLAARTVAKMDLEMTTSLTLAVFKVDQADLKAVMKDHERPSPFLPKAETLVLLLS